MIDVKDMEVLVEQCIVDVCGNADEPTLIQSYCDKMSSMSLMCNEQGLRVDWRGDTCREFVSPIATDIKRQKHETDMCNNVASVHWPHNFFFVHIHLFDI